MRALRLATTVVTLSLLSAVPALGQDDLAAAQAMMVQDLSDLQALIAEAPTANYAWGGSQPSGWVPREEYERRWNEVTSSATYRDWWSRVVGKMKEVSDRWENNPYIELEGFNVTIGWSPSVTARFNLRTSPPGP